MAFSILTLLFGWGKDLLQVTMADCCDTENAELLWLTTYTDKQLTPAFAI